MCELYLLRTIKKRFSIVMQRSLTLD